MHRLLALTLAMLLAAGWVGAAQQAPPAPKKSGALICTLTNQKIEKCCCEPRGEKLYCPLAKKTIEACCCKPADAAETKKPRR